jgi:bacterioferritin-associated ferredoxin
MPYICPCNGLSGKFTQKCLAEAAAKNEPVTSAELYRVGTGGKIPKANCDGGCIAELAGIVKAHNRKIIPILPERDPL